MARIDSVFLHSGDYPDKPITVHVSLIPSGTAQVKVDLPPKFKKALLDILQTAANAHEAQMRAAIIADEQEVGSNG